MVYFLGPWSALMVVLIQKGVGGAYMAAVLPPTTRHASDGQREPHGLRANAGPHRTQRSRSSPDRPLVWPLNYQIEHHLFPGMPRLNMRRAQPIIQQFCREKASIT